MTAIKKLRILLIYFFIIMHYQFQQVFQQIFYTIQIPPYHFYLFLYYNDNNNNSVNYVDIFQYSNFQNSTSVSVFGYTSIIITRSTITALLLNTINGIIQIRERTCKSHCKIYCIYRSIIYCKLYKETEKRKCQKMCTFLNG